MEKKEEDMHGERSYSSVVAAVAWKEDEKKYGKHGWKLVEINRKHRVLEESSSSPSPRAILDLCAAPGEWMKVVVDKAAAEPPNKAPKGCFVLGVDILPMNNNNIPILINNNLPTTVGSPPATTINIALLQEDITTSICSEKIKKVMEEHGCPEFDLVLHDGVPDFSCRGLIYNALTVKSLEVATQFLAPNGTFVTKAYRSQHFYPVLYCIDKLFEKCKVEDFAGQTYLIGLKYKAPSSIDPRLLDTRHLFRNGPDPPEILYSMPKRTPITYKIRKTKKKVCSARKFVWSDAPLELLSSISQISFEGAACVSIKNHYLTTDEVRSLCSKIYYLSKRQIKHLIQWHTTIREALTRVRKAAPPSTEVESKERQVVNMLRETVESMHDMYRKKNRAKKLIAEQQSKDRTATCMQTDDVVDGCGDQEQVALSTIRGKKDLVAVDEIDEDFEEEGKRHHEQLHDLLDQAYKIVVETKYGSPKRKDKHSKDERYEVTFDDDVYDADVLAALFSRCIFDSDMDDSDSAADDNDADDSDSDVDEVDNKAKSVGEEKRGKGKVSSKQGKESSNVIWKEKYFDSTEEITLPKAKRKQVPASRPSKKHKHRESGKGCSVCRKRNHKELQRSKGRSSCIYPLHWLS